MADKLAYAFGLDIGIASVGWAVLADTRIVDLGVRAFDKAETADRGESLNLQRRTARLLRRRLFRRAWRLTKLARLLKNHGLTTDSDYFKSQPSFADSAWHLRKAGLDRLLSSTEWARVLYHLCKHRGFHWFSKAEEMKAEGDAKSEGGRVKQGLRHTTALMKEKGYRTAAEMVLGEFVGMELDAEGKPRLNRLGESLPAGAARNKQGNYDKALSRVLLDDELGKLFEAQRRLGNPHAGNELEIAIRGNGDRRSGLFWKQKPALAGKDLLKMLGRCTFEKQEYRAPKASYTAERHVWLTRLNNLRVIVDGISRPLNEAERTLALSLPYQSGEKFTYKHLRNALVKAGLLPKDGFRFGGLSYPSAKQKEEEKAKDPEEQVLVKLPAWHELRLALKKAGLESEWLQISAAALEGRPEQLDAIGWALSVYKDDDEIRTELNKLALPGGARMTEALLPISFDKFHALSLKALRRIVPLMEQGKRYDEAVAALPEYGHHSQRFEVGTGQEKYLPPFYEGRNKAGSMKFREDLDVPRNPVVLRALNQARKVVNALIREYGAPASVHIEMARDLSRPLDERKEIKKLQDEYKDRNDKARDQFNADFNRKPTGAEFEKWSLYREQHGKCAYSLEALDLDRVINDSSYVQIDHALPYSRSYDDSKNNKVLALTRENQNKGNRTAYEYLTSFAGGETGERWRNYVAWVEGNKSYRQAKRSRLLRKNYGPEEAQGFKDRNLNDTRYICRFFKNYIEQYLQLAEGSEARRCVVVNGQLTAFLRARWGLLKIREESDRHHALDAAVVAACSHAMVKRLADHARRKELEYLREGFPDPETGEILNPIAHQHSAERFPEPWPKFRDELEARRKIDDMEALRAAMTRLGTYPPDALQALRPLFVSRAPQRRNGGSAHMDTIYAKPRPDHRLMVEEKAKAGKITRPATPQELEKMAVEKIGVFETADKGKKYRLTEERLKDVVAADRNSWMVHSLHLWLIERGDDPKHPGTTLFPRKPQKCDSHDGPFTGPEIKSVKANAGKMTGFEVRGGIAQNERLIRLDVFRKDRRYFLVPLYIRHKVAKQLPIHTADESIAVDDSYDFLFSIHSNDLIEVKNGDGNVIRGYFRSYGGPPNPSNITLAIHDRDSRGHPRANAKGEVPSIGVRTAAALEKLHIDVLGRVYPAPQEKRRGLA